MASAIFVALYVLVMIGVGVWGMRRTTTLQDYFLGGRGIGPVMSALAYGTTYFSAVLFIGFAGKLGWGFGLRSLWIAAGNAVVGSMLAWMVLGRRTRIMTHNLSAMTMPEFFEARYADGKIKVAAALIIFIFLIPYSASVFKGLGHLFEIGFGISYVSALVLMVVITAIYLVLGGYFAVALTDFIQGLIMLGGATMMVWVLTGKAGGIGEALAAASRNYAAHIPEAKQPGGLLLFSLVFMTSFGAWGLPQMVQKFYAVKSEKAIRTATVVTTLFAAVIVFSAYFTGALTHVFFEPSTLPLANGKPSFDEFIPRLLENNLPPLLMGLILLLVLSASMSTLAGLTLVSSSAIAIDIYQQHRKSAAHDKRSVLLMRALSAAFIALSLVLALKPIGVIVTLMSLSWGAVAGSFMAIYFYGLYWRRATRAGAWAGMLTGLGLGAGLFFALGADKSPIASTIAMIVPFAVTPLVSAFTRPPDPEIIEKSFREIG